MTTNATQKLSSRQAGEPRIVTVGKHVHVAVNYDASFMSMISGPEGMVVVDTGSDPYRAAAVMDMFYAVCDQPLRAIILTHSHPDHTGGLPGVVGLAQTRHPGNEIEIWARGNYGTEFGLARLLPQAFARRGERQFGGKLPKEQCFPPLGPRTFPDPGTDWPLAPEPVRPNCFFAEDSYTLAMAGLELELYAAPGETSDHLYIWMPEEKIVFAGDNIYGSFPNLYAVRGSGYRDVAAWAESVKKIWLRHPAALIMGHSEPLLTPQLCEEWLSHYHEAIQFVFDATIEGMNKGLTADELAETIVLPAHLAAKEFLTPYYGNVPWAVRSIFAGHVGWFDGDARKLWPLPLQEEAKRMVDMAGGEEALVNRARKALDEQDPAWAAQLVSYALRFNPENREAREINAQALQILGEETLSTSGRNYLLTCALEERAKL